MGPDAPRRGQPAPTSPVAGPVSLPRPTFAELFTPKLVTVLREGYGWARFRADAIAGLTVAIVALPLSMAIAIASGTSPERGLYAGVVGGFLVSALGGSRFQIGGPAGAFIVLIATTIERHGLEGLFLATILAGLMMVALGLLRLGTYIKYIPHPVTVGFTAGIAVIIAASQIRDLLGLQLAKEPAAFVPKLAALWSALPSWNPHALALSAGTVAIIVGLRRWRPAWPGFLVAVALAATLTALFGLPVETIGTRFGGLPSAFPVPRLPVVSWDRIAAVLPEAFAIALLGSIESLLSAVVADALTGRRHRSNCELVAQGLANVAAPVFGGLTVTGTIARTATNVRAGAVGPVAGILHAGFVLLFILLLAPLASAIPLAALAGILVVVAWNMAERHELGVILARRQGEAAVLLATFLLTVFRDLTEAILVGVVLGSLLFMHRMAQLMAVEGLGAVVAEDEADRARGPGEGYRGEPDPNLVVYRVAGPLFFGTASTLAAVLERIGRFPRVLVLDLSAVPLADAAAAASLRAFVAQAHRNGARVLIAGATRPVRRALMQEGLRKPLARFTRDVAAARAAAARQEPSGRGQP